MLAWADVNTVSGLQRGIMKWQITNRRIRRQLSSDLLTLFIRVFFAVVVAANRCNKNWDQKMRKKEKENDILLLLSRYDFILI